MEKKQARNRLPGQGQKSKIDALEQQHPTLFLYDQLLQQIQMAVKGFEQQLWHELMHELKPSAATVTVELQGLTRQQHHLLKAYLRKDATEICKLLNISSR
ncbi:hypothetical protein KCM76_20550 [Zooshikella marina]|uniref:Uncharacterized protein n=1 Tax=Zooshikella ganghwensis TaxID=202772 RepID=A0A4P9VHP6_9GAMM|nr:hypothetical protein [Zooshikella ganghwensis]MBU2708395.1 hypothetical protein [Zooshikella ganghwensis]RDH42633.1 hypothetical protein B9G39_03775 [Zooshikella ganghwensis]